MKFASRLHERLAAGSVALGTTTIVNSPAMLELFADRADIDFVVTDIQHGAVDAGYSVHLLRALQAANPQITPLARVPDHHRYWIAQSLDAGYQGLIVPLTESAEQAEKLVRRTYYPPMGARSKAGSIRAVMYEEYFDTINDRLLLLPQIESAQGLEHVEEIVAVDGVSGVLLGPCDLSLDIGWRQDTLWDQEPFLAAAQRVATACNDRGKIAAVLVGGKGPLIARDMGYRIIGFTGDGAGTRTTYAGDVNAKAAELRGT